MTEARTQINELQQAARRLPYGTTKTAMLEEAVRIADTLEDVRLAYRIRDDLMQAATFAGRHDVAIVTFSWCLAQYDRDRSVAPAYELLWKYKWVVNNARQFPEISRARLFELLDDMERRHREYGSSLHAFWLLKRSLHQSLGEPESAAEAQKSYRRRRRDFLSDCIACVAHKDCSYHRFRGHWSRALKAAEPVLTGRMSCAEQPHLIYSHVLIPLLHLKRLDEASEHQARGYKLVARGEQFVEAHSEHLQYMVLTGNMPRAKGMLERHLPGALKAVSAEERFAFLLAARLWTDRLLEQGVRRLKVRLPEGPPAPDARGESDAAALGSWFGEQARAVAARFDARNGNTWFQQQIDALPDLMRLATD